MKFWSCCQRKTSDFNQFLQQEPCSKGEHNWADAEVRVEWQLSAESYVIVRVETTCE